MAKKTKQKHLTPEEVKMELGEEAEQATDKECATEIEEVLKKHNRALQPYLSGGDAAIVPRVRLVRTTAQEDKDVKESEA